MNNKKLIESGKRKFGMERGRGRKRKRKNVGNGR
jgi:hypothetical protein